MQRFDPRAGPLLGAVTPVLMAKMPHPHRVKTRLAAGGALSPHLASELAWAMLACTAQRLAAGGRLILAVSPDGSGPEVAARLGVGTAVLLDQGGGGLGDRLDRVWRRVGVDRLVAFFGGDSPDVPDPALAEIPRALDASTVAIGPTADGGYWTLAARSYQPALLGGIEWGAARVYDQTRRRAMAAGLTVHRLPVWHDVDHPEDVDDLRRRLRNPAGMSESPHEAGPLRRLRERLEHLLACGPSRGAPP